MVVKLRCWIAPGVVLLGAWWGSGVVRGQTGCPACRRSKGRKPRRKVRPRRPRPKPSPRPRRWSTRRFCLGALESEPMRAPQSPPPPPDEQPADERPSPDAKWVPGYWSWDAPKARFVWVSGAWRVPPAGGSWVLGRWKRDANGWYRVPGYWSLPRTPTVTPTTAATTPRSDWHLTGPPADAPTDAPGPAPGDDFFYVPGGYAPEGDRLVWKPGYWARMQPGWDWVPAPGSVTARVGLPRRVLAPRRRQARRAPARRRPARRGKHGSPPRASLSRRPPRRTPRATRSRKPKTRPRRPTLWCERSRTVIPRSWSGHTRRRTRRSAIPTATAARPSSFGPRGLTLTGRAG